MKILGIAILMMVLLMGFSLGMDILEGFKVRKALQNALNPFVVMEVAELAVLYLLLFLYFMKAVLPYFKKRKAKKPEKQTQR